MHHHAKNTCRRMHCHLFFSFLKKRKHTSLHCVAFEGEMKVFYFRVCDCVCYSICACHPCSVFRRICSLIVFGNTTKEHIRRNTVAIFRMCSLCEIPKRNACEISHVFCVSAFCRLTERERERQAGSVCARGESGHYQHICITYICIDRYIDT